MPLSSNNIISFRYFLKRLRIYHVYYRRSGLYKFILINLLKLILVFGVIFLFLYLIQTYIFDLNTVLTVYLKKIPVAISLVVFFLSESLGGLLPPDVFIVWSKQTVNPLVVLSALAVVSYAAGYVAFLIGQWLSTIDRFKRYLNRKFSQHIISFNKWGAALIIIAALFPLPWGIICTLSGLMKYPKTRFLLFALTRLARFYIYAIALYRII